MSFLTDLFEGHNTDKDWSHAVSSFKDHPTEQLELGGAVALAAAPFVLPELAAGLGGAGSLFGTGAAGGDILTGGAALGLSPEAAAASGGFEAAAGGGLDAATAGYGTAGFMNAAGENIGTVSPLAQGSADVGSLGAESASVGKAGAAASGGNFLDTLISPSEWTLPGIGKGLGVAAAGAGLGMNLMRGNQVDPNQQKMQDIAGQLGQQGQVLQSYLKTGKLPPALQAQLDQAKAGEKARIIAGAAARGQPTDPRMNSALAQELNNVDTNAIAAMAQVQVNMLNTGLKETGMSMELYQTLAKMDEQQNQDLMKSITNFAAALGGGFGGSGGGMTLKVA